MINQLILGYKKAHSSDITEAEDLAPSAKMKWKARLSLMSQRVDGTICKGSPTPFQVNKYLFLLVTEVRMSTGSRDCSYGRTRVL